MVKFISYRELRNTPSAVWEALQANEAVAILANGEPRALMLEIENDDLELVLQVVRRVRAQIALTRLRASAAESGANRLTAEEIGTEIGAARARRKRPPKRRKA